MDRQFTPIVITGKKARKNIEVIKSRHTEILQGMNAQAEKVKMHQEMKKQEEMQRQQIQAEQDKVKRDQQMKDHQEAMDHARQIMENNMKMRELEMKHKSNA